MKLPAAPLRVTGLALLVSAFAISIVVITMLKPGPGPISLNLVRISQNQNGSSLALVELTNRTHHTFTAYAFWTEVLGNGVWVDAIAQHPDARTAELLRPHGHRTLEVPVPREGSAWRIQLDAGRPLGRIEALVDRACRSLKVRSPVAAELHACSETNAIATAPKP